MVQNKFVPGFVVAIGLLAIAGTSPGAASPDAGYASDPATACQGVGGRYIGKLRCQMPDGQVTVIYSGAEAARVHESSQPVRAGTPRAWVLAATALTFEVNGDRRDLLAGTPATLDAEKHQKELLVKWWGVSSRAQLLDTLHWLQFEGHRARYEALVAQVKGMKGADFMEAAAALEDDPDQLHRLLFLQQHPQHLERRGMLAWDLVRYLNLCRWAYVSGYLTEAEAWDDMLPVARRLQLSYRSWRDLQDSFLLGRDFWSASETERTGARFKAAYTKLFQDPQGPWAQNPWTMDLQVAKPAPVEETNARR